MEEKYSILLVDPPRMGLGETVCNFAIQQDSFTDILYISCGRNALQQDLNRLLISYYIADCQLLDLFPRTNAVETLVHLKRRQRQ